MSLSIDKETRPSTRCGAVPARRLLCLLIVCLTTAYGCASPKPKEIPELFWPAPPVQPRYAYVDYFSNGMELKGQRGAVENILGGGEENVFEKPYGIAATRDGSRVYVSDYSKIHVFDLDKKEISILEGKVAWPFGMTTTHDGLLYVTDMERRKVDVFDAGDKLVRSFGSHQVFDRPAGIAVDEKRGRVYVADARKHTVIVFDTAGKKIAQFGEGPSAEEGRLYMPSNVAVGSDGTVYVSDGGNFRVQAFSPEGEFLRSWGEIGDTPGTFARPKGIAVDSEDHVYVVDAAFNNIQVFRNDGQLLLWFGGAGEKPGTFLLPATLSIDDNDRIYVIQQEDPTVQVFQYLGSKYFEVFPERKIALEEKTGMKFRFGEEAPPAEKAVEAPAGTSPEAATATDSGVTPAAPAPAPAAAAAPAEKTASPEAGLLIQVLELRFGALSPEQRNRVESADAATIKLWGTRVLGAETVDDVFSE